MFNRYEGLREPTDNKLLSATLCLYMIIYFKLSYILIWFELSMTILNFRTEHNVIRHRSRVRCTECMIDT